MNVTRCRRSIRIRKLLFAGVVFFLRPWKGCAPLERDETDFSFVIFFAIIHAFYFSGERARAVRHRWDGPARSRYAARVRIRCLLCRT
jgi:hypothetical protein